MPDGIVLSSGHRWRAEWVTSSGPASWRGRLSLVAIGEPDPREREAIVALHQERPHQALPPLAHADDQRLVFDVRPLGTLSQLVARAERDGVKADYKSVFGVGALMGEIWPAVHGARSSQCSGRLGAGQIFFDRSGTPSILGLGTGLFLDRMPDGHPDRLAVVAPEVQQGVPADRRSDVWATAQLAMLVAPRLILPAELTRAIAGTAEGFLADAARWFQRHVLTQVRADRTDDFAEVVDRFVKVWRDLGVELETDDPVASLRPWVRELLGGDRQLLRVARDGSWFQLGAERVDLSRRGAPRRILAALAAAGALDMEGAIVAGWPGERILPEAARSRVHMAVSTLRKLGLGDRLLHDEVRGYHFSESLEIERI